MSRGGSKDVRDLVPSSLPKQTLAPKLVLCVDHRWSCKHFQSPGSGEVSFVA